jgi:hypothetical protein
MTEARGLGSLGAQMRIRPIDPRYHEAAGILVSGPGCGLLRTGASPVLSYMFDWEDGPP